MHLLSTVICCLLYIFKSGFVIRHCIWITVYEAWILPTEGMAESEHGKQHLSKFFSTGKRICPESMASLPALDIGCVAALTIDCEPKVRCAPYKIQLRQAFR